MKREDALVLAEKVVAVLQPFCERVCVAGSLRRERSEVGDIDIVALPKPLDQPGPLGGTVHLVESSVWSTLFPKVLSKIGLKLVVSGPEILRFNYVSAFGELPIDFSGFQVDVYRARPETWGVILLVRTGSKEHNVKLCSLAKAKGLKLSAAEGVVTQVGFGQIIASKTEEEIFAALGLAFVEPKDREVRFG